MVTVIVAGAICVLAAISALDLARAGICLALLAVFTVAVGSRITIQIPRFKSKIWVSATFIFLFLLRYVGEYAF